MPAVLPAPGSPLNALRGLLPAARGLAAWIARLGRGRGEEQALSARLAECEERLRLALSGARAGFWQVSLDPRAIVWDEGWRGLYGFGPDEAPDEARWRERVHPEDLPRIEAALREGLAGTTEGWNHDFRILHPVQGERWIHDRVRIRRDARGRPVAYGGLHFDFTARKRMEDALRESETRLLLAQNAGGVATWEWKVATGEITWSGPLAALGLPAEGGGPSYEAFMAMIHPDDRAGIAERVHDGLSREPYAAEFRITDTRGGERWLAGRGDTIRDAGGRPVRMIGINYDITARKEAEAALARLNADLERRVEEGAAKVAQLQKMESIGRLTGGIAHDFNNLLAVVLGNLEVLQGRLPRGDARAGELVANAMRGAERGAALTQRLLAFARRQDLTPEPVDVPDLVRGMVDLLARSIGPAIRIETRFAPDLPRALVDAHQLELAILNLAVNARDAMPAGGRLLIAVDEAAPEAGASPPGPSVRLRVADTGCGMDEATLRRAMEPFFTTKGVGKGTGLGLSIVDGLAAQSGGRFALRSAPGQGTTAEIHLPLAAGAARPEAPAGAAGPVLPAGVQVLVVDDDPLVLGASVRLLEAMGHRPVPAGSGFEALTWLRAGHPVDLVLTDEVMPGLRGLQLAALVAQTRPDVPVLLATGHASPPEEGAGLVVGRLHKPFRRHALEAALARALPSRAAAAEERARVALP